MLNDITSHFLSWKYVWGKFDIYHDNAHLIPGARSFPVTFRNFSRCSRSDSACSPPSLVRFPAHVATLYIWASRAHPRRSSPLPRTPRRRTCAAHSKGRFSELSLSPSSASVLFLAGTLPLWEPFLCLLGTFSLLRRDSVAPPGAKVDPLAGFLATERCRCFSLFLRCSRRTASGVRVRVKRTSCWSLVLTGFTCESLFTEVWPECLCCCLLDRLSELVTGDLPFWDEGSEPSLLFAPDTPLIVGRLLLGWLFFPSCFKFKASLSFTEPPLSSFKALVTADTDEVLLVGLSFPASPDTERVMDTGGMKGILAAHSIK